MKEENNNMAKRTINTKPLTLLVASLLVLTIVLQGKAIAEERKEGYGFLGLGIGIGYLSGGYTDLDRTGYPFLLTGKYFFTNNIGIGLSITATNREGLDGLMESTIVIRTLDIMYSLESTSSGAGYIVVPVGSAEEDLSLAGISLGTAESSVIGIGAGWLEGNKGSFTWGAELRYLSFEESAGTDGVLQMLLQGGIAF